MDRNMKQAGSSLDSLVSSFNTRIVELQELVIARNMYPATTIADLSAVDTAVKTMEYQMQAIKDRLQEEIEAIPKAKKLIEQSMHQQRKLQHMLAHLPPRLHETTSILNRNTSSLMQETINYDQSSGPLKVDEEPVALPKEKKGRGSASRWYITAEELDSLSSYMRGRLTLDKVNAAVDEMATYADANAHLITGPKKKLGEDAWEKALMETLTYNSDITMKNMQQLRDIAMTEAVKGKHFFLETDMKGPGLKLDNTGKAILTVLRHLGRVHETRIGHHRVIIVSKPQ